MDQSVAVVCFSDNRFVFRENGSHYRLWELIEFLQKKYDQIIVYTIGSSEDGYTESVFHKKFPDVKIRQDKPGRIADTIYSLKNLLLSIFPGRAKQILQMGLKSLSPVLTDIRRTYPSAHWYLNFVDSAARLNGFPSSTAVMGTIDFKAVKMSLSSRTPLENLKLLLRLRGELAVLRQFDCVIAISPLEALFFRSVIGESVQYIPTFSTSTISEPRSDGGDHQYDLVFVGANSVFNVEGLLSFIDQNALWLKGYRFVVCGRVGESPRVQARCKAEGIHLIGFVEDLADIYSRSKIAISPVDGTGLKIKVVEALSFGKPVFGSRHSMDALPVGYSDCVFEITQSGMTEMIERADLRLSAEAAALRYSNAFRAASDVGRLASLIDKANVKRQLSTA